MGRVEDDLTAYYRSPPVRARIAEYAEGAWLMAGYGGRRRLSETEGAPVTAPQGGLDALLEEGTDVCRSLADRGGTLLQIDVDYTDHEDPADPYRRPEVCFARLEPVYRALRDALAHYGLQPLALMTGRGWHFTLRVPHGTPLHAALLDIGSLSASLRARYETQEAAVADIVAMGQAHDGAGRLAEHLAHRLMRELAGRTDVPVHLADVPPPGRGPFICLDLSAYADPLLERHTRCAFSANQKAFMHDLADLPPFALCLPRGRQTLDSLLELRRDPAEAAQLAAQVRAFIPDAQGTETRVVEDYRRSRLARFHEDFDRWLPGEDGDARPAWERLNFRALPPCVGVPLEQPNPALLKPVNIRSVALGLWEMGWEPRAAAALVRSRYESDQGWGTLWLRYDPASRAQFYVRLACGAFVGGVETGPSFTCESQRQRGACTYQGCGYVLGRRFSAWDVVAGAER